MVYSSYQAVSGSGQRGLTDLDEGRQDFYPYPITGVSPHIDTFWMMATPGGAQDDGQTRKILHLPDLAVTATTCACPCATATVSINVQLAQPLS